MPCLFPVGSCSDEGTSHSQTIGQPADGASYEAEESLSVSERVLREMGGVRNTYSIRKSRYSIGNRCNWPLLKYFTKYTKTHVSDSKLYTDIIANVIDFVKNISNEISFSMLNRRCLFFWTNQPLSSDSCSRNV